MLFSLFSSAHAEVGLEVSVCNHNPMLGKGDKCRRMVAARFWAYQKQTRAAQEKGQLAQSLPLPVPRGWAKIYRAAKETVTMSGKRP